MKIYTKTGDKGQTGLLTGQRLDKDSLRVEAYGTVDEINSALALGRAFSTKQKVQETIYNLQKMLMLVMAELSSIDNETSYVSKDHIQKLEALIDSFDAILPPLTHFIIPGENQGAAALDLARTTTRRAERQVLRLSRKERVREEVLIVLNRLSDLCFMLSRIESTKDES